MKKIIFFVLIFTSLIISCKKENGGGTEVVPAPEITSIVPSSANPGDEVVITGKNFGANPTVFFGNSHAEIISKSSTEIRARVPEGSGAAQVYVQVASQKSGGSGFTFTNTQPVPQITNLQFKSAITGDTLIVSGSNFGTNSKLFFGTKEAQIVSFTENSITSVIPLGSGSMNITVQNSYGGSFKESAPRNFTYTPISHNNNNYASLVVGGTPYKLDTLSYFKIGPGTNYFALRLTESSGSKPLNVFITTVDVTNQYMSMKPVVGRDSVSNTERPSAMAARKSVAGSRYIAGTNSDFWQTTPSTQYQRNANMIEGVLASMADNQPITGTSYAGNAIFDQQKKMYIDGLEYSASATIGTQTMQIDTINYYQYSKSTNLTFFNQYCGKTTGTNNARTEVAVTPVSGGWNYLGETSVKVVEIYPNKGNNEASSTISILSGATGAAANFLNQLKKGDELNINFRLTPRSGGSYTPYNVTGGRQIIMRGGVVLADIWNGNVAHPRTGVGFSHSGTKVYMCVVDGRTTASAGVLTSQMAEIMKYFGATDALNFDGGGSSGMFVDKLGVVNYPSDGSERAVVSGLFAVSSAPDNNAIAEIAPKQFIVRLSPGGSFTPVFYGLNEYGQIVNTNLTGVSVTTNGLGTFTGGNFIAGSQSGFGYIVAKYNNLSTRIKVFIQ